MRRTAAVAALFLLALPLALLSQTIAELPPRLTHPDKAGGRVHAIAVNPVNSRRVVIAAEFGGLWKTDDDGGHWSHVDGLDEIFVADVVWTNNGTRLVATVSRNNQPENGGGFWFSDDGDAWQRGTNGAAAAPDLRIDAMGLSVAPDDSSRVYAGTTVGVSTSSDGGARWTPMTGDPSLPGGCTAVQALPARKVVAFCSGGVYRRDSDTAPWRQIRSADGFSDVNPQMIDLSPVDRDQLFIMQNYDHLLLYEVAAGRWTDIPLAGGWSRWPVVKVGRGPGGATDIFAGTGGPLRHVVRTGVAAIRSIRATDWADTSGAHADCGGLALGTDGRMLYFGSDGGLFRSADGGRTWTRAATGARTMNSLQMTDLSGTNVPQRDGSVHTALYFPTQDNSIFGSPDAGATWPNWDCAEGFAFSGPHEVAREADVVTAFGTIGCDSRFASFGMNTVRAVSNVPVGGGDALDDMGQPVYVSPRTWIRIRGARDLRPTGIYVSTDDGETWRKRADVTMEYMGSLQVSQHAAFVAFRDAGRTSILRMNDIEADRVDTLGPESLIRLSGDGSLFRMATMFDWHAVYAVDPRSPDHLVAADVVNGVIKETTNNGHDWTSLTFLTNLATDFGRYLFLDRDEYHMEITLLKFDPYRPDRIWVGTRDNGVVVSDSRGERPIYGTHGIKYVTGIFTTPALTYVSSYGRGLWTIDESRTVPRPPIVDICVVRPRLCIIRFPADPEQRVFDPREWVQRDVIFAVNGRILGIDAGNGPIFSIDVTPGTLLVRPNAPGAPLPFKVVETEKGTGFYGMKAAEAALQKNEVINGLLVNGGKLESLVSMQRPLTKEDLLPATLPQKAPARQPRVVLAGNVPGSGIAIVSRNRLAISVTVFDVDPDGGLAIVLVDGVAIDKLQVSPKGVAGGTVKLPRLSVGKHTLEVRQKVGRATAEFLVTDAEDEGRRR